MDAIAHLRGRPLGRIFDQIYNETDNIAALELLSILDREMEQLNLYTEILEANPKLLGLLLRLSSFASFHYYDYMVTKQIGARILRCKCCDLVGPYATILSHMAISHNVHTAVNICMYCDRYELKKHFENSSLDQCYQHYMHQNEWDDFCSANVLQIVAKFFEMLKRVSKKFDSYSIVGMKFAENTIFFCMEV